MKFRFKLYFFVSNSPDFGRNYIDIDMVFISDCISAEIFKAEIHQTLYLFFNYLYNEQHTEMPKELYMQKYSNKPTFQLFGHHLYHLD